MWTAIREWGQFVVDKIFALGKDSQNLEGKSEEVEPVFKTLRTLSEMNYSLRIFLNMPRLYPSLNGITFPRFETDACA